MKLLDKVASWLMGKPRAPEPPAFDEEAARADPLGALDLAIADLERTREDAVFALSKARGGQKKALEEALEQLDAKLALSKVRRASLVERMARKDRLEALASEATILGVEARALSDEDRKGSRGAKIRERVDAIRTEVERLRAQDTAN